MRRNLFVLAIGIILLSVGIGLFINVNKDKSAAPQPGTVQIGETETVDILVGTWKTDKMDAIVTDNAIWISWNADGTTGLYWKGSFVNAAKDGDTILSAGDVEAMEESFLSSRDTEKEFVYENGKLSFKRTVMGVTSVISLTRAS
jgi:Flp pilus assembly protein CpaB